MKKYAAFLLVLLLFAGCGRRPIESDAVSLPLDQETSGSLAETQEPKEPSPSFDETFNSIGAPLRVTHQEIVFADIASFMVPPTAYKGEIIAAKDPFASPGDASFQVVSYQLSSGEFTNLDFYGSDPKMDDHYYYWSDSIYSAESSHGAVYRMGKEDKQKEILYETGPNEQLSPVLAFEYPYLVWMTGEMENPEAENGEVEMFQYHLYVYHLEKQECKKIGTISQPPSFVYPYTIRNGHLAVLDKRMDAYVADVYRLDTGESVFTLEIPDRPRIEAFLEIPRFDKKPLGVSSDGRYLAWYHDYLGGGISDMTTGEIRFVEDMTSKVDFYQHYLIYSDSGQNQLKIYDLQNSQVVFTLDQLADDPVDRRLSWFNFDPCSKTILQTAVYDEKDGAYVSVLQVEDWE